MKSFFLGLFFLSSIAITGLQAQNLEYEVIRTHEAPGFFAVRVFPGEGLKPLSIENVFVENFHSKRDRKKYSPLLKTLKESGAIVVPSKEGLDYTNKSEFRIVLIGGPKQNQFLQFRLLKGQPLDEAFKTFNAENLGAVYLLNLKPHFGGNISDVLPEEIPYLGERSGYFIGKFDKEQKTKMHLTGTHDEFDLEADTALNLEKYNPHEAVLALPFIWEKLKFPKTMDEAKSSPWVIGAFPFLLVIIGLGFIAYSIFGFRKQKQTTNTDLIDDKFWHTPIEETPLYKNWEKDLPFEIESEKH